MTEPIRMGGNKKPFSREIPRLVAVLAAERHRMTERPKRGLMSICTKPDFTLASEHPTYATSRMGLQELFTAFVKFKISQVRQPFPITIYEQIASFNIVKFSTADKTSSAMVVDAILPSYGFSNPALNDRHF